MSKGQTIVGPTQVCPPSDGEPYILTNVSQATYTWSITPIAAATGSTIIVGTDSRNVTVVWNNNVKTGSVIATLTAARRGVSASINVTGPGSAPTISGSITGPDFPCVGSTVQYTFTGSVNLWEYLTWTYSPNLTSPIYSPDKKIVTFTVAGTGSGSVSVRKNSNCGQSSPISKTFTASVAPTNLNVIQGTSLVCVNTQATYTVENLGNTTYQWTVPSGVTIVNGAGTNQVTLSFGSNISSALIKVKATNSCGESPEITKNITVRHQKNTSLIVSTTPNTTQFLGVKGCSVTSCLSVLKSIRLNVSLDFLARSSTYDWGNNTNMGSSVSLRVIPYSTSQGALSPMNFTLQIDKDNPTQLFTQKFTSQASDIEYFEVKVLSSSIGSNATQDIRLRASYEEEREYDDDNANITISPVSVNNTQFEQYFYWTSLCYLYPTYELEIVKTFEGNSTPDWKNALKIEIDGNKFLDEQVDDDKNYYYKLVIAEGSGTYHWRMRAIGNKHPNGIANPKNWGNWTASQSFTYQQHQSQYNWIYSRVFSEGSRLSESMTFANGLLQTRQQQNRLQSTDHIIGSETFQDYSGRNVLGTLPMPMYKTSINQKNLFGFENNWLKNSSDEKFSVKDFDEDNKLKYPSSLRQEIVNYYGGTVKDVADAEGYAYTRTLFGADGRVAEQSGVGKKHSLNPVDGGKTIKTYYSSVADAELLRVFGKEAPLAKNTHKVITIDQNNVTSVSYQTKDGKTIATALSIGTTSSNLDPLSSRSNAATNIIEEISDKTLIDPFNSVSSKLLVFDTETTFTLNYTLTPNALQFICGVAQICQTCDYKVNIVLRRVDDTDVEDIKIVDNHIINPTSVCQNINTNYEKVQTLTVPKGVYILEKSVVTNNPTIDANGQTQYPLEQASITLQNYYQNYLSSSNTVNPDPLWASILTKLRANQLQAVYNELNNLSIPIIIESDDNKYYNVPINCSNGSISYIRIPFVNLATCNESAPCSKLPTNITGATGAASDFINLLQSKITEQNAVYNKNWSIEDITGTHNSGELQRMFEHLLSETLSGDYQGCFNCQDIWSAWQGQVAQLDWMYLQYSQDPENQNSNPPSFYTWFKDSENHNQEFLDNFFKTVKRTCPQEGDVPNQEYYGLFKITYHSNSPLTTLDKDIHYKTFYVNSNIDNNNPTASEIYKLATCTNGTIYTRTNTTAFVSYQTITPSIFANIMPHAIKTEAYYCFKNYVNAAPLNMNNTINEIENTCKNLCDSRKPEFVSKLKDYIRNNNITIDSCKINGMADKWVEWCKGNCDADFSVDANGQPIIGNTNFYTWLGDLTLKDFEVSIPSANQTCPNDWQTIGGQTGVSGQILWQNNLNDFGGGQRILFNENKTSVYTLGGNKIFKHSISGQQEGVFDISAHLLIFSDEYRVYNFTVSKEGGVEYIHILYTLGGSEGNIGIIKINASLTQVVASIQFPPEYDSGFDIDFDQLSSTLFITTHLNGTNGDKTVIIEMPTSFIYDFNELPWKDITPYIAAYEAPKIKIDKELLSNRDIYVHMNNKLFKFNRISKELNYTIDDVGSMPDFEVRDNYIYIPFVNQLKVYDALSGGLVKNTSLIQSDFSYLLSYDNSKILAIENHNTTGTYYIYQLDFLGNIISANSLQIQTLNPSDVILDEGNMYMASITVNYNTQNAKVSLPNCGADMFCFKWKPLIQHPIDPDPDLPIYHPVVPTCEGLNNAWVATNVESQIQEWINIQSANAQNTLRAQCDLSILQETFTLQYQIGYHHYTLYYYDRAGNLIRTVPPAGVATLPVSSIAEIRDARNLLLPDHKMVTQYQYNSLGKLVEQNTPDGGVTKFWYNAISQITHSQNAKQANILNNDYSHTEYDELGRVTEVYEAKIDKTQKKHITKTVYNTAYSNYLDNSPQRYLRNRVSYSFTDTDGNLTSKADQVTSYYSYDSHGNVEWMAQQQDVLGKTFVKYNYDLISGKVLDVTYNEGRIDQFIHRYSYDDENRITKVETSNNGFLWDTDATYDYYLHGPLKRTEIGNDKIQGLDYTYTIYGWFKAINHPTLELNQDPGGDGIGNKAKYARDAYGMVLNFYQGDYKNSNSTLNAGLAFNLNAPEGKELFGGQISSWSQRSRTASISSGATSTLSYLGDLTGDVFTYDELYRIKSSKMQRFNGTSWTSLANDEYATDYSYDGNGNIETLTRRANGGVLMDNLTYNYNKPSGKIINNKLRSVNDAVNTPSIATDIETQSNIDNYQYDEIGNLINDAQEGSTVVWNPYGKVQSVSKSNMLVEYTYDIAGNRVRKKVTNNTTNLDKTTYYVRDAQGNHLTTYEREETTESNYSFSLTERILYGSDRLGMDKTSIAVNVTQTTGQNPSPANMILPNGDEWIAVPTTKATYENRSYWVNTNGGSLELLSGFDVDATNAPNGFFAELTTEQNLFGETGILATRKIGQKQYELKDHLGNVRVVVTDVKLYTSVGANNTPEAFEAQVNHISHYYPFGMEQPNRQYTQNQNYRYGFNGKENDREWGTAGLTQDYGFRLYNPAIAKFLSVDPLAPSYPWYTPYQFAGNMPINSIDLDGLEQDNEVLGYIFGQMGYGRNFRGEASEEENTQIAIDLAVGGASIYADVMLFLVLDPLVDYGLYYLGKTPMLFNKADGVSTELIAIEDISVTGTRSFFQKAFSWVAKRFRSKPKIEKVDTPDVPKVELSQFEKDLEHVVVAKKKDTKLKTSSKPSKQRKINDIAEWLRDMNKTNNEINSIIARIDLSKEVSVVDLQKGSFVWRYERVGGVINIPEKHFFTDAVGADSDIGAAAVGFRNSDYKLVKYRVLEKTSVLKTRMDTGYNQYISDKLQKNIEVVPE